MSFLNFLFYLFLIYIGYKLVVGVIWPVYRTTRQVRRGFREMQERMGGAMTGNDPYRGGAPSQQQKATTTSKKGADSDDYIEFEEVR